MTSEEFLRVRGYLTAQGAKVLPEQLIGSVQEAMTKLRETATAASGLTTLRVDPFGSTLDARRPRSAG